MKRITLILFILVIIQEIFPQTSPRSDPGYIMRGELIVQLEKSAPTLQQDASLLCQTFQGTGLAAKKLLSARLHIWLFTFDTNSVEQHAMLETIKLDPRVKAAQFNHFVTLREVIPDDPFFPDQWAMMNTGQWGGLPDADIDATQAWEITTGGLTVLGDTIVLAIIDLGFDLEHEDIRYWKNYDEIPGNGLDDDGNGYTDDFDGWDAISGDGQLPVDNHGTHVTGIAGAIGNNGIGVTGVNWNVQIMPVASPTGLESGVVEAYGYVLEMRARYHETGGEQGAFVVATNASFGIDQGDPADYPVWGAMYDSLGAQGVLSAGATANANWNIDEVGDIPTAFPSGFLITVTNTTNLDTKLFQAGYGPTTIDLGAPGYVIRSTYVYNQYDYKTGTSMSTPFITGAIGLLFAAADTATMVAYRENPPAIALEFRNHILNSVDKLAALDGITVSGGRLNIYKMLLLLLGEPILQQSPVSVDIAMAPESMKIQDVILDNKGNSTSHYTAWIDPQVPWLSLTQTTDSVAADSTAAISLNFTTTGLELGNYYSSLSISYENDQNIHIPVHLLNTPFISIESDNGDPGQQVHVYPNPSAGSTWVELDLQDRTRVRIEVYDLSGRCVWVSPEKILDKGLHRMEWNGASGFNSPAPPGLYFCLIRLDYQLSTHKIIRY